MYVQPIKWKGKLKDFKFHNIKVFKGSLKPSPNGLETHNITLEILSRKLISKTRRMIKFSYIALMEPYTGEISFNGSCIFVSPNQDNIDLLLETSQSFRMRVKYTIHKHAYQFTEDIAKKYGMIFLPSKIVLRDLYSFYSKEIKKEKEIIEHEIGKS